MVYPLSEEGYFRFSDGVRMILPCTFHCGGHELSNCTIVFSCFHFSRAKYSRRSEKDRAARTMVTAELRARSSNVIAPRLSLLVRVRVPMARFQISISWIYSLAMEAVAWHAFPGFEEYRGFVQVL